MARDISVVRRRDLDFISSPPTRDVHAPEFEAWSEEALRRHVLIEPLGSEAAVREYWSDPAYRLALPHLASIYDVGFSEGCEWSGSALDEVAAELEQIESAWAEMELPPEVLADLAERLTTFRRAVAMAREIDGVVQIT